MRSLLACLIFDAFVMIILAENDLKSCSRANCSHCRSDRVAKHCEYRCSKCPTISTREQRKQRESQDEPEQRGLDKFGRRYHLDDKSGENRTETKLELESKKRSDNSSSNQKIKASRIKKTRKRTTNQTLENEDPFELVQMLLPLNETRPSKRAQNQLIRQVNRHSLARMVSLPRLRQVTPEERRRNRNMRRRIKEAHKSRTTVDTSTIIVTATTSTTITTNRTTTTANIGLPTMPPFNLSDPAGSLARIAEHFGLPTLPPYTTVTLGDGTTTSTTTTTTTRVKDESISKGRIRNSDISRGTGSFSLDARPRTIEKMERVVVSEQGRRKRRGRRVNGRRNGRRKVVRKRITKPAVNGLTQSPKQNGKTTKVKMAKPTVLPVLVHQCPILPDWQPCITKEEANRRFLHCCSNMKQGCHQLCNYDLTLTTIQLAVLTNQCPLRVIGQVLTCASGNEDAGPCCEAIGVFESGLEHCRPYCNPSAGLPRSAGPEQFRCLNKLDDIQRCFHATQKIVVG